MEITIKLNKWGGKTSLLPCRLVFLVLYRVPHLPVSPAIHHRIPARGEKNTANNSFKLFIPVAKNANYSILPVKNETNLLFGHVQQAHWVSLAVQIYPYSVECFVELSLNICQLLKHFAGRPEQHLWTIKMLSDGVRSASLVLCIKKHQQVRLTWLRLDSTLYM